MPKKEKLKREGDITGLLEVTVQGSRLMEIYASIEAFGLAGDVIGPKGRCTIVDKFAVIVLKRIKTPLFVSIDIFAI